MKYKILKLGDILGYEQPTKYIVKSTTYSNEYPTPVLTAGQSFILGYTNETEGVYTDLPVIIFDDFTTATKYVDFPFKVKSSAMKILKADSKIADDRYMFYQMQLIKANNDEHKRYWISKYAHFPINLPPLATQKRIAAILDAADAYRQKTKTLIAKYEELTQSLFLEMFGDPVRNEKGWEVKPFEYFADFDTKMTVDFLKYADYPHVGIANIEKETGKIVNCSLVKDESLASGKYIFGPEHIIYSKIRPNLNKVALPDFVGLCSADSYPLLMNSSNSNREFFAFLLRSKSFIEFILEHSTRTNIPKANKSQMKLYRGIAPPITLQNQFAERLQQIEAQKAQAQQSLAKAEELFNSLLQRAFKGELV